MAPDELGLFEAQVTARLEQLWAEVRAVEARAERRAGIHDTRLAGLESWQNQVLGAGKAGRVLWLALLAAGAGFVQLILQAWEHLTHKGGP